MTPTATMESRRSESSRHSASVIMLRSRMREPWRRARPLPQSCRPPQTSDTVGSGRTKVPPAAYRPQSCFPGRSLGQRLDGVSGVPHERRGATEKTGYLIERPGAGVAHDHVGSGAELMDEGVREGDDLSVGGRP